LSNAGTDCPPLCDPEERRKREGWRKRADGLRPALFLIVAAVKRGVDPEVIIERARRFAAKRVVEDPATPSILQITSGAGVGKASNRARRLSTRKEISSRSRARKLRRALGGRSAGLVKELHPKFGKGRLKFTFQPWRQKLNAVY
jgi:hypothetical protein